MMPPNNNPKSSFSKSTNPKAPQPINRPLPHLEKKDESLFHGHDRLYAGGFGGIEQTLGRDAHAKDEIKKILRAGNPFKAVSAGDVQKEIKKIEGIMDRDHNRVFTPGESDMAIRKHKYHEALEKRKLDPFTPEGKKKLAQIDEEEKFLEEKFGK